MKKLISLSLIALVTIVFTGCAKYEEGSNFSFYSAKARLANDWTLTKYVVNGSDETNNSPALNISFFKDNTFSRTFTFGFTVKDAGTWAFSGDKTSVILSVNDGSIETYKIIQLKNKDLKAERLDNGDTYQYTFKGN